MAYIYEYIGDYPGEMPHGLAKNSNQPYKRVTLAQKTTIADAPGLKLIGLTLLSLMSG